MFRLSPDSPVKDMLHPEKCGVLGWMESAAVVVVLKNACQACRSLLWIRISEQFNVVSGLIPTSSEARPLPRKQNKRE